MATRRRHVKTNRRKYTFRNKSTKNKTTRKIRKTSRYGGGKRIFKSTEGKKKSKTRWGERVQWLVTQREVQPEVLGEVLRLPKTEQHDIPSRFPRINGRMVNTSVKTKKAKSTDFKKKPFKQTGKRNVETGDALRFVSAILTDPDPYEMILVDYKTIGSHMTPYRQLRVDLKALHSYIFGGLTPEERKQFLYKISRASELIKEGRIKEGKKIVTELNNMLISKGSAFRLAPKVSSKIDESSGLTTGQKRLQGKVSFDFKNPEFFKHVVEEGSLSSGSSQEGVPIDAWETSIDSKARPIVLGASAAAASGALASSKPRSRVSKTPKASSRATALSVAPFASPFASASAAREARMVAREASLQPSVFEYAGPAYAPIPSNPAYSTNPFYPGGPYLDTDPESYPSVTGDSRFPKSPVFGDDE